ncbi:MAG TPA: 2Fe-2S iron-sulfur cluster-binding protein [Bryobacteraceae bacterium]|nr:2Fe-2S iron-sulfur cluster-binding protein [Bryobacteraceae bacterium]
MPAITYEGQSYSLAANENVLDALLRNGVNAAHSCKAGGCGSCLMRAAEGPIPARAQSGLKDAWKAQGYFLACLCLPDKDLAITTVGADAQLGATITGLELLSPDVLRVRLRCDAPLGFRAGQYVSLQREGGLARSYSIASLPEESDLELHVRRIAGGKMSGWLHDEARISDRLSVLGPSGDCFYVPGKEEQPLLLVGTGTGLAPLYGILRDAIRHGHRGPIHLFHGALHKGGLYLVEELRRLVSGHAHVEYIPAVLNGAEGGDLAVGSIDQVVLKRFPKLAGWRGYVCGDPALVQSLKKKLFLSGMASRDIYADAFLPAPPVS